MLRPFQECEVGDLVLFQRRVMVFLGSRFQPPPPSSDEEELVYQYGIDDNRWVSYFWVFELDRYFSLSGVHDDPGGEYNDSTEENP